MPNPKTVRNQLRGRRALTRFKHSSRPNNMSIPRIPEQLPPELRAAITADVERQLKQLVAEFGEKVREALDPLITKCKWNGCQGVANAIRRVARQC
jgi:hypothetical protein